MPYLSGFPWETVITCPLQKAEDTFVNSSFLFPYCWGCKRFSCLEQNKVTRGQMHKLVCDLNSMPAPLTYLQCKLKPRRSIQLCILIHLSGSSNYYELLKMKENQNRQLLLNAIKKKKKKIFASMMLHYLSGAKWNKLTRQTMNFLLTHTHL